MIKNIGLKDRNRYRLKYQYELIEALTGKKRRQIRDAMRYRGFKNSTEDFVEYLFGWIKNINKEYI